MLASLLAFYRHAQQGERSKKCNKGDKAELHACFASCMPCCEASNELLCFTAFGERSKKTKASHLSGGDGKQGGDEARLRLAKQKSNATI
jgi:hypothetical protein